MRGELISTGRLETRERIAMYGLLERHFDGVSPESFERDLDNKEWVLLIRQDNQDLAGFTTIAVSRVQYQQQALAVLYSGDTIMEPNCWGTSALARNWIHAVHALRANIGELPMIWLLICSGFRTYRFLPVFFREFFPRCDRPTPRRTRDLMRFLAGQRYGDAFDETSGIVRLDRPQILRPHLDSAGNGRRDAHIEFFERANPGHARGDELVCIASLDDHNLTRAGQRMVRAGTLRSAGP